MISKESEDELKRLIEEDIKRKNPNIGPAEILLILEVVSLIIKVIIDYLNGKNRLFKFLRKLPILGRYLTRKAVDYAFQQVKSDSITQYKTFVYDIVVERVLNADI